jgi:hypothetical protein
MNVRLNACVCVAHSQFLEVAAHTIDDAYAPVTISMTLFSALSMIEAVSSPSGAENLLFLRFRNLDAHAKYRRNVLHLIADRFSDKRYH